MKRKFRGAKGKFVSKETAAWARREKAAQVDQRRAAREAKAAEKLRAAKERQKEVRGFFKERGRRSRTKSGRLRAPYKIGGRVETAPEISYGHGWKKTVYRFKGKDAIGQASRQALKVKGKKRRVVVQVGTGYSKGAQWVGSKATTGLDAFGFLQGIGTEYAHIFRGLKGGELVVELLIYEGEKK